MTEHQGIRVFRKKLKAQLRILLWLVPCLLTKNSYSTLPFLGSHWPLNRLPHIRTLHIKWFRVLTLFNDIEHEPQGLTYYTEFGFPQRNGHR